MNQLALNKYLSLVAGDETGGNLHQRALARSVLAHKRMNLALTKLKMHIGEYPNRAEGLRDASHLKHGRFSHFICGGHLVGGRAGLSLSVLLGFTSSARKALETVTSCRCSPGFLF